ncbi:hypothetical protein MVEG_10494 [Podila verticillata NRRL 6337]|nr:hypothetical protein MVEG_10494 [Podila verticillata NRRL 6337]
MASSEPTDPLLLHKFKTEDGSPLPSLQSHLCAETGERYILWSDIQRVFNGIDHLETEWKTRVLFTINADGELHCPLRIRHRKEAYVVVIHRAKHKNQTQGFRHGQEDSQYQSLDDISPSVKHLFDTCLYLYNHLESITDDERETFQQAIANTRYYHSMLVEEIERLDRAEDTILVDEKGRGQLLKELHNFQQKAPEWDYRNIYHNTLHSKITQWDYAASALFLVLPCDLNSWDITDPSTHQFRLHFLCDNWNENGAHKDIPQHVHLSNHPGYSLKRPEEFFRNYGDYILRVLQMIKQGYSDDYYDIPPLETLKILWNCDPNIIGSHLAMDIESLVDRAISYFLELSPSKWRKELGLSQSKCRLVKTYLDVQDGDDAEGSLCRLIDHRKDVYWKCQAHAKPELRSESLEHLKEFVRGHGGHVDMQQATIRVELGSIAEADEFQAHLYSFEYSFDISVKLNWKVTRSNVKNLCKSIARAGVEVLELDGITLDIHPQGYDHYRNNLFYHEIIADTDLRFIMLLNYPRPQELCIHLYHYSLQLEKSPGPLSHSWTDIWDDLNKFGSSMSLIQGPSDWSSSATELKSTLQSHGLLGTYMATLYKVEWNAIFNLNSGAVIEAYSLDTGWPKSVLSVESIRTLGVHLSSLDFDQEFFDAMRANAGLRDLYVSYYGHNILYYTEHIVRMWHESSSPFRLTLLDRMEDTRGRVVAQLAIRGIDWNGPRDITIGLQGRHIKTPFSQEQVTHEPADIVFTQWDCDHIFTPVSDYSASILDMVTRQHPSVLTLFTLDVSRLSLAGLNSIQEVLRRSYLEHLNIVSSAVHYKSKSISHLLDFVQWSTLKSLVLSGSSIEAWINLWLPPVAPRLLSLQIQGAERNVQKLSHSSVLFIHRLICSSSLVELCFQNVQLLEKSDWDLIVESMDVSLLQTLDLGEHDFMQFLSVSDAITRFGSRLEAAALDTDRPKMSLSSFILDFATLSQSSLESVKKIFSYCCLEKLIVKCDDPTDHSISDPVARVLDFVPWSTLKYLCLTGDSINQWIQLLTKVDAPRLKSLDLCGAQPVHQKLTHSSVLVVERLISTSVLTELHFQDVQLQDPHDWVLLVEKMHPSMLGNFRLGRSSHEQFTSIQDAVDIEFSKRKQWWIKQREDDSE